MQDGEDLVKFIEEQREKIAYDRGRLKNNPASSIANNTVNRQILNLDKENRIPDYETVGTLLSRSENHDALPIQTTTRPPATPRILRLGDDYKRKQEKLKEELRADYRNAMAEKNLRTTGNRQLQNTEIPLGKKTNSDLGVSLPLKDRLSAKIKDASTETYEELLERKRKQEKSYRGISDDNDDIRERTRRRDADREGGVGHFSQKRVRFPSKDRRSHGRGDRSRRDDDFLGDEEIDDHAYRSRRGRTRVSPGRRERRCSSEEDSEYDSEEDTPPRRRRKNVSMERRRPAPTFENEPITGPLPASKQKSESDDHRSKAAPNDPKFTGLSIGQIPSANTVQQRKEEYRTQLLQQMEENKKQKKKERELDKRADAISFNEQFDKNNNNIEGKNVSPPKRRATPSPPPENADPRQRKQKKKYAKTTRKVQLDLSSEEEEGVSPRRGLHRGPHPSQSYFAPPLQPSTGYYPPQYANPYNDPYYYYGTRNPLDPGATSLPPPQPGGYPGVLSPVMAAAYATGRADRNESPDRDRNAPAGRRPNKNESSSQIADENKEQEKKKQQTILYQEELNDQIAQKQKEKQNAKKEQQRYDMNIENEARNYNPWGKGGGGAPMKDRQGNLISDLRNMHLENEEAGKDHEKAKAVVRERLPQTNLHQREERPVIDPSPRNAPAGDEDMTPTRFGRSNPFEAKQSDVQKTQRDVYKEFLQKQIEEKHRLEAEKRERDRLEEEKEERRFEEQRKKIQAELEAELDKDRKKKEMAVRKKMEEEDEQRRNREQELDEKLRGMTKSPAIPTLRNQQQQQTLGSPGRPPPPGHEPPLRTREETTVATQPPQKQPVAHAPRIQTYRTESPRQYERRPPTQSRIESERISRELSTLRKQLLSEQRRVEDELHTVDLSKTPTRKINTEYLVDLSRAKQKPVAVRRPPTVENERPSSRALREFSDYKYRPDDTDSIRMFRAEYPETPDGARALEKQQQDVLSRQGRNLNDLRHQAKSELAPTNRRERERHRPGLIPPSVAQSITSLLEAETTYIPIVPDAYDDADDAYHFESTITIPQSRQTSTGASARERRRPVKNPLSARSEIVPPRARPDNFSLDSLSSLAILDIDRLANRNVERLNKLRVLQLQGDDVSLTDSDDVLDRFVDKQPKGRRPPTNHDGGPSRYPGQVIASFSNRSPSVNTVDTEPWLRPETGPTVA